MNSNFVGIKKSKSRTFFNVINYTLMALLGLSCVLPFLNIIAISFSSAGAIVAGKVSFFPVDFSLDAYKYLLHYKQFIGSFFVSVTRVILGTSLSMLMVVVTAYPLSKEPEKFTARNIFMWFLLVQMFFGGGLIPTYLVVKATGLVNTIWALVLPTCLRMGNVILLMNFFRSLPVELEEAAYLDGAGHWTVLFRIYLPISTAALATIALFNMVGQWNEWFQGMIYMNKMTQYPLASYLRTIISPDSMEVVHSEDMGVDMMKLNAENMRAAQIFATALPILCTYPFLQKYFTKGIVMGSVKG